jgi:hypothetical protein
LKKAIDGLVHRAVSTDYDNELRTSPEGLPSLVGHITWPSAQERVAVQTHGVRLADDVFPTIAGHPIPRGGIYDEDGANGRRP